MSLLVHRGLVSELKETPPWVADCRGVLLSPALKPGSYEVRFEEGATWLVVDAFIDDEDKLEIVRSLMERCRVVAS